MKISIACVSFASAIAAAAAAAASATTDARPSINAANLQSFFDETVPRLMKKHNAAGVVASAVHSGNIAFQKGYGHANIETKEEVNPDLTLFRVGSVSKLFTWTAIFQLVERGKLKLDEDINLYLNLGNFSIPDTFPGRPITLAHIMSHTPGFEDFLINLFVKDPAKLETLEETVKGKRLRRVRPPGMETAYSNYGAMLAGYIVQLVSGEPFEIYIEEHIFKPLGMNSSTFRQPVPEEVENSLSKSYFYVSNNFTEWPHFEFVQGTPAGGMSSTASDMAKFLIAQLSANCGGILKEETLKKFHSTLFRSDSRINGMAHGLMEVNVNGQQVLGHGGDLIYQHSAFFFIPKENVGFFFSVNTGGAAATVSYQLFIALMDHFFSSPTGRELAANFDACTDLSQYTGIYLANRRSESDMTKLTSLGLSVKIERTKNETLRMFNILFQEYQEYVEIDTGLFQNVDGQEKIVFLRDKAGTVDGMTLAIMPIITFKRPPVWEHPILNTGILIATVILVLWGLLLPPCGSAALIQKNKPPKPTEAVAAARLCLAVAMLHVVFVISMKIAIDPDFIFAGTPPAWPFFIPWVAFIIGLLLPWHSYCSWKKGYWRRRGRIFYLLFTINMQIWFALLFYWRVVPQVW